MNDHGGGPLRRRPWALLLGPGPALARLAIWLEARCTRPTANPPESVEQLENWGELVSTFPEEGRILVDSAALEVSDRGRIEGFLDAHPSWRLHLCGSDPTRVAARRLLAREEVHWTPWPPDLEELEGLVRAPGGGTPPAPELAPHDPPAALDAQAEATSKERLSAEGDSAAAISDLEPAPGAPAHLDPELQREITAILERPETPSTPHATAEPASPAPFFRRQVADLADIAQRLRFSLERCREATDVQEESDGEGGSPIEDLDVELLRLQQFTRTLGYTASPPSRGRHEVDLQLMLEEQLTSLAAAAPRPLIQFAGTEPLPVEADKGLLAQALDAVLYLALSAVGSDGTLRIEAAADGARARVTIAFPAGPIVGLAPATILEPYGLASVLPELGPNALSAARGIVRGQEGSLTLLAGPEDHLLWVLELPLAT